ncbi:MAG: DUF3300 domain-containing protein [Verrucomicrobiota bacterium]|jgi:hypothetical protein
MSTIKGNRCKTNLRGLKSTFYFVVWLCGLAWIVCSVRAQTAVPPPTPVYQPLSDQQLDKLLGPIALYPDPLVAEILPAATLPTQIVLADRYVSGGGDTNLIEQQPWDPSVQALAHYPAVLKWMDDNLNWTTVLGNAFLNQQQEVMDSVQRLRASAQNLGNLTSTPQQQVIDDGGNVEIVPADPDIIYVPLYDPNLVYYASPYGPPFITFGGGFWIGWWLNCDFDWWHRNLITWDHDHPRPRDWWHQRGDQRYATLANHGTIWHPAYDAGVGSARRGDRGWNNSTETRAVPSVNRLYGHQETLHSTQAPQFRANNNNPLNNRPIEISRPINEQASEEHFAPASRPPANDTFIGIQSPEETRSYSDRGQQSMGTISRPEPERSESAPRSAPSYGGGGGGGGGGHSSGGHH